MTVGTHEFVELSVLDQAEILALLQATWPVLYGKTGCPAFSAEYLDWLYGGPDASKHYLYGCRNEQGELIGFKAALYRKMSLNGVERAGYIASHLAIRADLGMGQRIVLANELSQAHTLDRIPDSVNLAYFEADKALVRKARRGAEKAGHMVREIGFQQYVVNPRRLRAYDEDAGGIKVNQVEADDCAALTALINGKAHEGDLIWNPDPASAAHHLLNAPGALAIAAHHNGRPEGVLGATILSWLKSGEISKMLVCDILIATNPVVLNQLLREAVAYAQDKGLRGVVVENVTYFTEDYLKAGGLLKSPRQMNLFIRAQHFSEQGPQRFICDVK